MIKKGGLATWRHPARFFAISVVAALVLMGTAVGEAAGVSYGLVSITMPGSSGRCTATSTINGKITATDHNIFSSEVQIGWNDYFVGGKI